ncbi:MAG: MotA/TolQ/ExbB proton channel family protein [Opitutales bacterium]
MEIVIDTLRSGGLLMIPLALLTCLIYFPLFSLLQYLMRHNYYQSDYNQWAHWVERPQEASGEVASIIRFCRDNSRTEEDIRRHVNEVREAHLPRIDGRINYVAVLVGTAPLMGLLGTVAGMLATFEGLAVSFGGNTIDLVAGGISEALITTQTGLIIAIPGYILLDAVRKRRNELAVFFNQLEIQLIKQTVQRAKKAAA